MPERFRSPRAAAAAAMSGTGMGRLPTQLLPKISGRPQSITTMLGRRNSAQLTPTTPLACAPPLERARSKSLCLPAAPKIRHTVTAEQAQALVARSLDALGPLKGSLGCILAHEDLKSLALQRAGFGYIASAQDQGVGLEDSLTSLSAVIVVVFGTDASVACRAVEALNTKPNLPPLLTVLVVPFFGFEGIAEPLDGARGMLDLLTPRDNLDAKESIEVSKQLEQARTSLLDAGSDDVITLFDGELLRPHRVMEAIHRTTLIAERVDLLIKEEVAAAKAAAQKDAPAKHSEAYRKLLAQLPGQALDELPFVDNKLAECRDAKGALIKVGAFTLGCKLGAGSSGGVYKADHPTFGTCVLKSINKTKAATSIRAVIGLDRECCLLQNMEAHPNVIKGLEVLNSPTHFYVAMDFAGPWSLYQYSVTALEKTKEKKLPGETAARFGAQMAAALAHVHRLNVCHRDLKPDNWIVSQSGESLRLADFGFAVQLVGKGQRLKGGCGSLPFCSPEQLCGEGPDGNGYSGLEADVWSLGVNFLELLLGPRGVERLLGWGSAPTEFGSLISSLESLPGRWASIEQDHACGLGSLVGRMLVVDPDDRWRMDQVAGAHGLALNGAQDPGPARSGLSNGVGLQGIRKLIPSRS